MNRRSFLQTAGYIAGTGAATFFPWHYAASKNNSLEKVLLIGIDGLCSDALQKAETPHIYRLAQEGAYSFKAKAGKHTLSYPGWSNIFTGVWENKHGIITNPVSDANQPHFEHYPSFVTRAKTHQPKLAAVSLDSWNAISLIIKSMDKNLYHSWEKGKEEADSRIADDAAAILARENPDIISIYLVNADATGHKHGFGSAVPEYRNAVEKVDRQVGRILSAMRGRSRYRLENWLTVLISDHGGKGKSHDNIEEARIIPFIMHGPSVKKGEIIPAPTQVDVAPTVLTHLKIPLQKEWGLDGKVVGLR